MSANVFAGHVSTSPKAERGTKNTTVRIASVAQHSNHSRNRQSQLRDDAPTSVVDQPCHGTIRQIGNHKHAPVSSSQTPLIGGTQLYSPGQARTRRSAPPGSAGGSPLSTTSITATVDGGVRCGWSVPSGRGRGVTPVREHRAQADRRRRRGWAAQTHIGPGTDHRGQTPKVQRTLPITRMHKRQILRGDAMPA